jgi:hypothetical protein
MTKEKTAMQLHIEDLVKVRNVLNEARKSLLVETVTGCIENAQYHQPEERQQIEEAWKRVAEVEGNSQIMRVIPNHERSFNDYFTTTYGE